MIKKFYLLIAALALCFHVTAQTQSIVTTPANGSTTAEAPTLKVTVKAVTGATRYTVQLNSNADFSGTSLLMTSAVDNQRTLTFTKLRYNTTYYARVKTNINQTYGPSTSFRTKQEVFPLVISPGDGQGDTEYQVNKITIRLIPHAKKYSLQLSTNSSFTSGLKTFYSIEDAQSSFIVRDLSPGIKYYTRAKTDVSTTWGPSTTFTNRERGPAIRLWGVTTSYNGMSGGTIYSFSVDSLKFRAHHHESEGSSFVDNFILGADGFYGLVNHIDADYRFWVNAFRYNPATNTYAESPPLSDGEEVWMMMASSGTLYATIDKWETMGKLRRMSADFSTAKDIHFFSNATGRDPRSAVVEHRGNFYGTTYTGGVTDFGAFYKMQPSGAGLQVLYNFQYGSGYFPESIVYGNDGYFYGSTIGSQGDYGSAVFRVKTDGSSYQVLHMFDWHVDGDGIAGTLLVKNGVIYGCTGSGGPYFGGVLFRMNTDGSGFRRLKDFDHPSGSYPNGSLVMDTRGFLYGSTQGGGANSRGAMFRIKTDGTQFRKLYDFTYTHQAPIGKLIITEDTFTPPVARALVKESAVHVYPNPTINSFTIRPDAGTTAIHIELIDFSGAVIHSSIVTDKTVEIGHTLPKGMYILRTITDGRVATQRLFKK